MGPGLAAHACAGGALESCGRIAAATGAALICETAFARLDRGAGLPALQRLPYFPQVRARRAWGCCRVVAAA